MSREKVKQEYFPKNNERHHDSRLENIFPISVIKLDVNKGLLCSSRDELINWIFDSENNIVTEIETGGFAYEMEIEEENKILYFNKGTGMRRLYNMKGEILIPDYTACSKKSPKFLNPTSVIKIKSFDDNSWHLRTHGNGKKMHPYSQ